MGKPSWLVTLTPLLIAALQLAEAYLSGSGLTAEKATVFFTALMAFVGSGAIGAYTSVAKAKLKQS